MQFDFTYSNPTTIHFGKNSMDKLTEELEKYGSNILLLYGGGSIKKNGIYDAVMRACEETEKNVYECTGVMPNPTYEKVKEGARICKEHNIDLILAVGGGSTIDCAKAISVVSKCDEETAYVKYWVNAEPFTGEITPVGSILTMAATGSENNSGSVITNDDLKLKIGIVFPDYVNPQFSICNPEFTYTLSDYQMSAGIFDIFSHLMEGYFAGDDNSTSLYVEEGFMKSLIESARKAKADKEDYEARSNIMWISSWAMNPFVAEGKKQDWMVHQIEHQLGAYTDCTHGMGLAAISVPYYRYVKKFDGVKRFARFAQNVWGISAEGKTEDQLADAGLDALLAFIKEMGLVTSIRELGATEEMLPQIANSSNLFDGGFKSDINPNDILEILKAAM